MKERLTSEDLFIRNDVAFVPRENEPFTSKYERYSSNGKKIGEVDYINGKERHEKIEKKVEGNANTQGGFGAFHAEAEIAKNKLDCPNFVDSDITPASFDGDGALYGCIQGKMETVKWFINEIPNSNRVNNVKFLWNDWFKDMGYGVHPDKQEAQKALKVFIKLYAPEKAKELNKIFFGNNDKTVTSDRFTLKYTYDRRPAIDERMIEVTER